MPSQRRQARTFLPSSSSLRPMRVGFPHSRQTTMRLLASIGDSRSRIPPLMFFCGFAFVCLRTKLTPSTIARPSAGKTRSTRPVRPLLLPASTTTLSSFRTWRLRVARVSATSDHLRSQRNDLHEVLLPQLARHRPEDARADRLAGVVDQDGGVLIEADVGAVLSLLRLVHPDDDRLHDLTLLDGPFRDRFLDVGGDHVSDPAVEIDRPAPGVDAGDPLRPRVVGDLEDRPHLYHLPLSCHAPLGASVPEPPTRWTAQRPR